MDVHHPIDFKVCDQFLELVGKGKLYPPLNGYSVFLQGSEYNTQKYFKKWYEGRVGYSLLVLMKKGFSQVWLPEEDFLVAAEYGLHEYLNDQNYFARRNDCLVENIEKINTLYDQYTYKLINESNWETLFYLVETVRDLMWDANAAVNFTVFLDKQLCAEILKREKHSITEKEFDVLWEKATEPAFESFDKSQLSSFLKLVKENTSWEMIKEQSQYILSDYHSAKTLAEVDSVLNERYAKYINQPKLAAQVLEMEKIQFEMIVAAHEKWLSSLPENERVIARYLQTVMEIRDRRKNFFAKGMTIIYRIAERMFAEAKVGRELIPYYSVYELLKGINYLKTNAHEFASRVNGFEWLVPYEGNVQAQSCNIDSDVEKINTYFKNGHVSGVNQNIIHGQPAFKGKVRGIVRVVLNVNSNAKFIDGEILVAGMTRPEYVPLMKKAIAVVTDEGGITCHAAIVSRELKIPCITGTKIATRVLRDGDLVEVNADSGVVKILKKA